MSDPVCPLVVARLLASYPHVARCRVCCDYAADYLPDHDRYAVLVAVLNHHDSGHTSDRLDPRASGF